MTNQAVIENKISAVRKYLKILERYKKHSRADIEKSIDLRGAVERYLYLVVQAAIDLAEAVISFKNFRKPSTLAESFRVLEEEGLIQNDLTEKLAQMAGFRNIIAHDYGEIDYEIVYNILQNGLNDIEKFINNIQ